jgi:thiamine-monophosphate kinase
MPNKEDILTGWFARRSKAPKSRFPIGIGDDMAQVRLAADGSVLITTDMLLDGTHFDLATATIEQVGVKAMNCSLSDCAAMATIPMCAVAAVALPKGFGAARLKQLHKGLVKAGSKFDCHLIGGDITAWSDKSGRFAVNVTMLSRPAQGIEPIRRNGARPGDAICVTGTLGGSLRRKHLNFTPRVWEALALARAAKIHAMMDITDGLSTDLNRICRQSGVGAILDAQRIPLSKDAKRTADPLASALHDGEDFELLFTLHPRQYWRLENLGGIPVTRIGIITECKYLVIRGIDGCVRPLRPKGYDHL